MSRNLLLSLICLAACSQPAGTVSNNANAAAAPPANDSSIASATPTTPAPPPLDPNVCPPAPTLVFPADFPDPRHDFAPGKMGRQLTEDSFREAYAMACRAGIVRGHRIGEGAADPTQLIMRYDPESSGPIIYVEPAVETGTSGRRAILKFRFFDANHHYLWPMVSEINEAIYCHVHGATPREREESGRCPENQAH